MLKNMKNRDIEELEKQLGPRIAGSGPGTTGNRKNKLKTSPSNLYFVYLLILLIN